MYLHSMLQGKMLMKEELLEEARIKWHSDHIYKKRVKKENYHFYSIPIQLL